MTAEELEKVRIKDPKKAERLGLLIRSFRTVPLTTEAEALAQAYIDNQILNEKKRNDARHLALATLNEADYLISWNFDDLVNVWTRERVNAVNILKGYQPIQIIAPPELK